MGTQSFKLPDVGEGLTEAEILQWFVKPGDTVTINQVICEIETAKAAVELPSPFAGVVKELLVAAGTTVNVGTPIITVTTEGGEEEEKTYYPEPKQESKRTAVLVGYGVKEDGATTRRRRATSAQVQSAPAATRTEGPVFAKPPVRKYAKSLGVDLRTCRATGPNGSVSRADVDLAAKGGTAIAGPQAPVFTSYDAAREERIPVKGVLKQMSQAMVQSAFTAPHVTEWVDVEVSGTLDAVEKLKADPAFANTRVSPLLIVMAALIKAAQEFPKINCSWDEAKQEVVVKQYVNLGIAAATPRGLLVPVIHDSQKKSLHELAQALTELIDTAREGKTSPEAMSHPSISITNVGVFGVDGGTPILPPGTGAILAFGQIRQRPWVVGDKVEPRPVCELTLSFDHRMIDGELGSKVLARVAALLNDPVLLLS